MKSIFKVSLLAAAVVFSVACQKKEESAQVIPAAATVESKTSFTTEDQKASYAIGTSLAKYLKDNIEQQKKVGVELDTAIVIQGVTDLFSEKSMMTDEEAQTVLQALDQRISKLMQEDADKKALAAKKAGDEYRAKFSQSEGVKTTASGLMYQINTEGKGKKPVAKDTVVVHYKGTLTDGTPFDSSYDRNEPATFPLDRVIPGWTEGVQLMPVGSKFTFVIPPDLAYGDQNTPNIPANSTLIFEVELLDIKAAEAAKEAPKAQG